MAEGNYKLFIDQGSTLTRTVSLKNADGSAYDLTGATIAGQIRPTPTSSTLTVAFTVSITAPASLGQFVFSLTAVQTAAITVTANTGAENIPTLYAYDIEMTKSSVITRLIQGEAVVSPEVTRP